MSRPEPPEDEGEEIPVLGPEHEIDDEEGSDELLRARILEDEVPLSTGRTPGLRKLYESEFRKLERDFRIHTARHAHGDKLLALCLDPDPQVVAAVLDNASSGLDHARLIALNHKNAAGLEHVVKRAALLRDGQVRRGLLRNDQAGESALRRMLGGQPLRDVFKAALDRDIPHKNNGISRALLRERFARAAPEEKVDFIVTTEARCLALLVGQTFDARTTAILCARQYNSTLLILNLVRFAACPPQLLAHFLKQPYVQRQPALKKAIEQHPNLPSHEKRSSRRPPH